MKIKPLGRVSSRGWYDVIDEIVLSLSPPSVLWSKVKNIERKVIIIPVPDVPSYGVADSIRVTMINFCLMYWTAREIYYVYNGGKSALSANGNVSLKSPTRNVMQQSNGMEKIYYNLFLPGDSRVAEIFKFARISMNKKLSERENHAISEKANVVAKDPQISIPSPSGAVTLARKGEYDEVLSFYQWNGPPEQWENWNV